MDCTSSASTGSVRERRQTRSLTSRSETFPIRRPRAEMEHLTRIGHPPTAIAVAPFPFPASVCPATPTRYERLQLASPRIFRSPAPAKFASTRERGTEVANPSPCHTPTPKPLKSPLPKSSLTPCVLEEDPVQLDALAALIAELGYECVPTSDPEEALKAVRYGRCRLMLAGIHGSSPGLPEPATTFSTARCAPIPACTSSW